MRPLIALVMIVKDEAETIAKTIESCKSICDLFVIVDTGSTDDTKARAASAMSMLAYNMPDGAFIDFSTTRNEALGIAASYGGDGNGPVFMLMLSGGEILVDGDKLRKFCEENRDGSEGAYLLNVAMGSNRYYSSRLIRTDAKWRYVGKTHEVLIPPVDKEGELATVKIPGCHILHEKDVTTEKQKLRWEQDRELLALEIAENPDNARAWFYLAQTYECLERKHDALTTYNKRSYMGGFWEEVYVSKLSCLRLSRPSLSDESGPLPVYNWLGWCVRLYDEYPHRAEPLYEASLYCYERMKIESAAMFARWAAKIPYPENDLLRIDASIYLWRIHDLVACTAGDNYLLGLRANEHALRNAPNDERVMKNFLFYLNKCNEKGLLKKPELGGKYSDKLKRQLHENRRMRQMVDPRLGK